MKISKQKLSYIKSTAGKILAAISIIVAISVLSFSSAFAERDHGGGRGDRHDGHGGWHGGRDGYRHGYGYGYAQPVYIPPPVYAVPPQSPGISLILPLNFRR
ncbi:MAG: hypothetical protein ABSB19_13125 [Methylomonas sp.]